MAEAIAAFFNENADRAVRALWLALADAGLPSLASLPDGTYPPHISLVGAQSFDGVDWDDILSIVAPAEPPMNIGLDGMNIGLDGVDTFSGGEGILYLRVRPTAGLARLQAQIYRALARTDIPVGAYYAPDAWRPHCTLAVGMSDAQLAEAATLLRGRTTVMARIRAVGIGALSGAGRMLFTINR